MAGGCDENVALVVDLFKERSLELFEDGTVSARFCRVDLAGIDLKNVANDSIQQLLRNTNNANTDDPNTSSTEGLQKPAPLLQMRLLWHKILAFISQKWDFSLPKLHNSKCFAQIAWKDLQISNNQ